MTDASTRAESSYRPALPDWGVFLRPPASGVDWIHPDDTELALQFVPSRRVLRRHHWDGEFYWLSYGASEFRLRPCMWCRVPDVDLEVGQQVELLSRNRRNDAGIYRIAEIVVAEQIACIEFQLRRDELLIDKHFAREDLRPTQVRHYLRTGYYQHPKPSASLPDGYQLLNVGNLLDD